jgi:O-acetyl-ADP-ribose deacetylase (regulator of RNase III)
MKTIKGDLIEMGLNNDFDIIVQGCNCFCVMGSGIAAQIAQRLPDAKLADDETVRGDAGKLGTYTIGMHGRLVIVNAYTQFATAKNGEDVFEYNAFQRVLDKLVVRLGTWRFGFPLIGMGLAGGDKDRIMSMLEDFSNRVEAKGGSVTIVEFDR